MLKKAGVHERLQDYQRKKNADYQVERIPKSNMRGAESVK